MKVTGLIARISFSMIFLITALSDFSAGTAGYAASHGIPLANVLVPLSGIISIAGALSIIFGYKIKSPPNCILPVFIPLGLKAEEPLFLGTGASIK